MTSIGDFRLEVFMLEDYYVKPSTVDRVRGSWLANKELLGMAASTRLLSPRCISPAATAFSFC